MAAKVILLRNTVSYAESANVPIPEKRRILALDITNSILDHECFSYLVNFGDVQSVIKFIDIALEKYDEIKPYPEYTQHKNNIDRVIAKLQWQRDQY